MAPVVVDFGKLNDNIVSSIVPVLIKSYLIVLAYSVPVIASKAVDESNILEGKLNSLLIATVNPPLLIVNPPAVIVVAPVIDPPTLSNFLDISVL